MGILLLAKLESLRPAIHPGITIQQILHPHRPRPQVLQSHLVRWDEDLATSTSDDLLDNEIRHIARRVGKDAVAIERLFVRLDQARAVPAGVDGGRADRMPCGSVASEKLCAETWRGKTSAGRGPYVEEGGFTIVQVQCSNLATCIV
jgi:hypothetical protein